MAELALQELLGEELGQQQLELELELDVQQVPVQRQEQALRP